MDITQDRAHALAKSLKGPDQALRPPWTLILALATVRGDMDIVKEAVAKDEGQGVDDRQFTRWRYVALAETGLIVVEAEKAVPGWEMGPGEDRGPEASFDARFIPLREVTFCAADGIKRWGNQSWTATWSIGIRGGESVPLPALRGSSEDATDALGSAIRDRLAASGK